MQKTVVGKGCRGVSSGQAIEAFVKHKVRNLSFILSAMEMLCRVFNRNTTRSVIYILKDEPAAVWERGGTLEGVEAGRHPGMAQPWPIKLGNADLE